MTRTLLVALLTVSAAPGADQRLRPPLRADRDDQPITQPKTRHVSELYAIVHNTWLRHLSPEDKALRARDSGALNVNAWDDAPDSSWFTNRAGQRPLPFKEIVSGLEGRPPAPPPWQVLTIVREGYTPKLRVRDSAGRTYFVKFDLPTALERNSAAERICTLIMHAAGYNVPYNTLAYFGAGDLSLDKDASFEDATGKRRPMRPADLDDMFRSLKPLADGRYRGLASLLLPGKMVGRFVYTGRRADDPNDLIPHELRRELRGMRVIASWINHVDVGDKNAMDAYNGDGRQFVKHYLIDFGSALGSGDFVNGPYRVGHEYIFDGPAMGRAFVTLGAWRRPWEANGRIRYPEVGYYQAELFDPPKWKPNYPNLAFERMDDADAYWGARIVTAFSDGLIDDLVKAGEYSRREVAAHLADVLKQRRDAIGRYWFDRITPLEDFALRDGLLDFKDLAVERGYAGDGLPVYRYRVGDSKTGTEFRGPGLRLPELQPGNDVAPDRFGRKPLAGIRIQSRRRDGGWALPVEVILGRSGGGSALEVLGWRHAAR